MKIRRYTWLIIAALSALLLAAACDRHIESKDPVRSLPAEPSAPINVSAQINDRAVRLSWEVEDSANIARFRIYRAPVGDDDYILHDSTTGYTTVVRNLPLNQPLHLQVRSVTTHGIEGSGSEPVTVTVGLLSITIANNNEYTNSRNVQVQMNAPGTAEYVELSEDPTFAGTAPAAYSAQRSFTLSAGDGEKTVYARFTFEDGSLSGDTVSDQIILDTYAQIDSVYFAPVGETFTIGDTILFYVAAGGETDGEATVSFPGVGAIHLNDGGTGVDATADDGVYSGRYIVPVGLTVNGGEVVGDFTDAAGNDAVQATAAIALDIKAPPMAVQITSAEPVSNWQVTVRWTQSNSSDFDVYRLYRATSATVSDASQLITSITQASTTSFTDTTVGASTKYFYRIYVTDNSGLKAGSNVDSATTTANTAPSAVTAAASLVEENTAGLSWTRCEDDDFASYRIYRDTSPSVSVADDLITIISDRNTLSYQDYVPFPGGGEVYYYRVMVFDRQGLTSSSNEVQVSR